MRPLLSTIACCSALLPSLAWAEPALTGVELESTEPEVRD